MIKKSKRKHVIHCSLSEIYTAVALSPGICVLLHVPRSCSHLVYNAWLNSQKSFHFKYQQSFNVLEDNLFVSCLGEKEAIFGGERLLEASIKKIMEQKQPECLLVVSGCTASIIGDDVEGVCTKLAKVYNKPIIHIPGSGFMSNQSQEGMLLVTRALYENIGERSMPSSSDTVTILGVNKYHVLPEELEDIKRIYRHFGITKILFPPCGMSIEDFRRIDSSCLIGTNALVPGKLKEYNLLVQEIGSKLGVPHLEKRLPLTLAELQEYLTSLGKILQQEELAEKAWQNEKELLQRSIQQAKTVLQGKSFIFAIGRPMKFASFDDIIWLMRASGMELQQFVFLEDLTAAEEQEYRNLLENRYAAVPWVKVDSVSNYNEADVVITDLYRKEFHRQYCIKRKRVGIGGLERFLKQLTSLFLENRGLIDE